jgi:hypothetical protein
MATSTTRRDGRIFETDGDSGSGGVDGNAGDYSDRAGTAISALRIVRDNRTAMQRLLEITR